MKELERSVIKKYGSYWFISLFHKSSNIPCFKKFIEQNPPIDEFIDHCIISCNKETLTMNIDGQVVVLSLESGRYYGLEGAVEELWLYIQGDPVFSGDIIAAWAEQFENSVTDLKHLLIEAVKQLGDLELLFIKRDN